MTRTLAVLLLLVVAAGAAACGSMQSRSSTRQDRSPTRGAPFGVECPSGVLVRASILAPVSSVLHAAQRVLARQTITSQGTTYHLTPRNAPIDQVEQLAISHLERDRAVAGRVAIHRVAAAACGEKIAQASWAIHYQVPVSVIAGPGSFPFLVKTKAGWRFWGYWCGAGRTKAWRQKNCF
jgi:hypothetical protein